MFSERMKGLECHDAIFVEPVPNYDEAKHANWGEIANIIFKAYEKEKNSVNAE